MKTSSLKFITSALLLGALGSGLWSIVGEPALDWFVQTFISLANYLNEGYYDLLHENIGKGFHEDHDAFFRTVYYSIFIVLIISIPFFSYKVCQRAESLDSDKGKPKISINKRVGKIQKTVRYTFIFSIVYSLLALPFFVSRLIVIGYNNEAIVFTERSIEILSPKISQSEILALRASYRSVSDAEGFYQLYDVLENNYKKHGIELPEFKISR